MNAPLRACCLAAIGSRGSSTEACLIMRTTQVTVDCAGARVICKIVSRCSCSAGVYCVPMCSNACVISSPVLFSVHCYYVSFLQCCSPLRCARVTSHINWEGGRLRALYSVSCSRAFYFLKLSEFSECPRCRYFLVILVAGLSGSRHCRNFQSVSAVGTIPCRPLYRIFYHLFYILPRY